MGRVWPPLRGQCLVASFRPIEQLLLPNLKHSSYPHPASKQLFPVHEGPGSAPRTLPLVLLQVLQWLNPSAPLHSVCVAKLVVSSRPHNCWHRNAPGAAV